MENLQSIKKDEELEGCTFHPKLNPNSLLLSQSRSNMEAQSQIITTNEMYSYFEK